MLVDDSVNIADFDINGGYIQMAKKVYSLDIAWNDSPAYWYLYETKNRDKYDNIIASGPFRINTSPFKILAKALHTLYEIEFPDHLRINETK